MGGSWEFVKFLIKKEKCKIRGCTLARMEIV
jgi:hypothetical protein